MRRGADPSEEDSVDAGEDESDLPEETVGDERTQGQGDEEGEEEPTPSRLTKRARRKSSAASVRPWTISDLDDEEAELAPKKKRSKHKEDEETFWQSLRRPVFFRARDSWYFEPLVALAIIILLLVSLYAYTATWPPVYVVESGSMQHGAADQVGLINAGDLVLVKKVNPSSIVPYVLGEQTGYSTYGEYGDVILYQPNGQSQATPVIHRAILYLDWDSANQTYSAPALATLSPCGNQPGALYSIAGRPNGCGWSGLFTTITLYHVGWQNATVSIPLGEMGRYSGFITMGDNNLLPGSPPQGETDQGSGISSLVAGSWVIGVARGMLPWVGSFKLLLDGNAGHVPPQSWQFLGLTFSAIVLAGFALHYLFRVEGIEDPRRLREEREEREESDERTGKPDKDEGDDDWEDAPKGSRWKGLRAWLGSSDEEEEPVPRPKHVEKHSAPERARHTPSARSRGRPRPAVRTSKGFFHRSKDRKLSKGSNDETL
jgi:signal peptidase I